MIDKYEVTTLSSPRNAFNNDGTVSIPPFELYVEDTSSVVPQPPFSPSAYFSLDKVFINTNYIGATTQNYVTIRLTKDFKDSEAKLQLPKSQLLLEEYKFYAFGKAIEYLKTPDGKGNFISQVNNLIINGSLTETKIEIPLPDGFSNPKYPQNLWTSENLKLTLGFFLLKVKEDDSTIQEIFIQNNLDFIEQINIPFYDVQFAPYFKYYGATVNLVKSGGNALDEKIIISIKRSGLSEPIKITNYPPQIPNVSLTSYNNVNNKLLFLFQKNSGFSISPANDIDLFTADQIEAFKKIINKLQKSYSANLVFATSQNDERYFVVYRTETKPETFADIVLPENIIKKLDILNLETSFVDKVFPNKKYYYCFRVEDSAGILSDTTLVYEAEIIDQSGTIYMIQNVFKPERKVEFVKKIDFENRFRVSPTSVQIEIPEVLFPFNFVFDSLKQKDAYETNAKIYKLISFINSGFKQESTNNDGVLFSDFLNILSIDEVAKEFSKYISTKETEIQSLEFQPNTKAYGWKKKIDLTNEIKKINQFVQGNINNLFTYNLQLIAAQEQIKQIFLETQLEQLQNQIISLETQIEKDFKDLSILLSLNLFMNVLLLRQASASIIIPPESVFKNKRTFKFRVQSQNSKKKFDVNVTYNIQVDEGVKNLSKSIITKNFEVLKTEKF